MSDEIYVSTDVEADGPIPGPHSMLSFGSAAYTAEKRLISTYTANLKTLDGASGHPDTMKWWATQPAAWAACRENVRSPAVVMPEYRNWLSGLPGKPVFVGYPAAYDFLFVYWYLIRFAGKSPFSHSALDIKTYAMAVLGTPYRGTSKKTFPREWFDDLPHTHCALDDAIEQGALFCNILAARKAVARLEGGKAEKRAMCQAVSAIKEAHRMSVHEVRDRQRETRGKEPIVG